MVDDGVWMMNPYECGNPFFETFNFGGFIPPVFGDIRDMFLFLGPPIRFLVMCLNQCHKPPVWEWFIPPIKMIKHGEFGDGLLLYYIILLFYQH
jgi:hypothetical protein